MTDEEFDEMSELFGPGPGDLGTLSTAEELYRYAAELRAKLAQVEHADELSRFWHDHYDSIGGCVLCGNSGVLDTRGASNAAGVEVGRMEYCICPNGREMRERAEPLPMQTEPSLTMKVWRVDFTEKYKYMKMLVAAHTKAEVYNLLQEMDADMRRGAVVTSEQTEFVMLGVDVRTLTETGPGFRQAGMVHLLYAPEDNE